MTDFVQLSGNPTAQQAGLLRLGIAASQTACTAAPGGIDACVRRWYVAAFAVLVLLTACANSLVRHAFSFEANEEPGIEILDYRYGESRQPGARPDPSAGRVRQGANIIGDMRRPDALYVRWRDKTSGKVYEDTVDLARLLPWDITDHRIHFTVRGPQLFVYLITPQRRSPSDYPAGPPEYHYLKVITLASDFGREVSTSK